MNFHSFGQYTGRAGPNNSQYFNPMVMAPLFVPNPLALQQHLSLQHNILSQQILFQQMMMMRDDILWRGLPHPSSSALSQHDNDNRLDTNDASGLLVIQSSAPKQDERCARGKRTLIKATQQQPLPSGDEQAFVPILNPKMGHKTVKFASRNSKGKAQNRQLSLWSRPGSVIGKDNQYVRVGAKADDMYFVSVADMEARLQEIPPEAENDSAKAILQSRLAGLYHADLQVFKAQQTYIVPASFVTSTPMTIYDESGRVTTELPAWFTRLGTVYDQQFKNQLKWYRRLISPKSGGGFKPILSRYVQMSDIHPATTLYIAFNSDIKEYLKVKVKGRTQADPERWLKKFGDTLKTTSVKDDMDSDDEEEQGTNTSLVFAGYYSGKLTDNLKRTKIGNSPGIQVQFWDAHPMDLYRVYMTPTAIDHIKNAKRPDNFVPPNTSPSHEVILKIVADSVNGFGLYDGIIPATSDLIIKSPVTDTCVTTTKYLAASGQARKVSQNAVMDDTSANSVAAALWGYEGKLVDRAEWAHRSGFKMGGLGSLAEFNIQNSQVKENLIFGTKEINTRMIRFEDCAHRFTERWDLRKWEVDNKESSAQELKRVYEDAVTKIRASTEKASGKRSAPPEDKIPLPTNTTKTTNPGVKDAKSSETAPKKNASNLNYAWSHPHLQTQPTKKSLNFIAQLWTEYKGRLSKDTRHKKSKILGKDKVDVELGSLATNVELAEVTWEDSLTEGERTQALSRFLWVIPELEWEYELSGHSNGFQPISIKTTFNMWDLHVPLVLEAKLDMALDTELWDNGYWNNPRSPDVSINVAALEKFVTKQKKANDDSLNQSEEDQRKKLKIEESGDSAVDPSNTYVL